MLLYSALFALALSSLLLGAARAPPPGQQPLGHGQQQVGALPVGLVLWGVPPPALGLGLLRLGGDAVRVDERGVAHCGKQHAVAMIKMEAIR